MSITESPVDTSIWSDPSEQAPRALRHEVSAWALSPDDQWIAWADAASDAADQMGVFCAEISTGRVVFEKRGRPVKSLAFTSPEQLLVVREETRVRARAVLHAVPDGGVLGSVALDSLPVLRCKIEVAQGAPVALVAPVVWHALPRAREPARRLAYVLRTDALEVIASYDPDESAALPRMPEVRRAVASLSPEGHRLLVWQGPTRVTSLGVKAGAVLTHDWTKGRDTPVVSTADNVCDVTWMGPGVAALRCASGDELTQRGDLYVVDLSLGVVRYASEGEDQPDGWMSGRSTVDVHPDRERLVVTGRLATGATGAKAWRSLLREVWPGEARASKPREVSSNAAVAMGAAWLPEGDGLCVLRARTQREGEIVRLRTIDGDWDGATVTTVPFAGRKVSAGRLSRSPGGTLLVARWHVDPELPSHLKRRASATLTGPVNATRLALVDAARFR